MSRYALHEKVHQAAPLLHKHDNLTLRSGPIYSLVVRPSFIFFIQGTTIRTLPQGACSAHLFILLLALIGSLGVLVGVASRGSDSFIVGVIGLTLEL